jgi:hypothetical protein
VFIDKRWINGQKIRQKTRQKEQREKRERQIMKEHDAE